MDFKSKLLHKIGISHKGGNFILDKGSPYNIYSSYLHSFSKYIKMIKLGWTTWSLFSDKEYKNKVNLSRNFSIPICLGGTLFEICYAENLYDQLLQFIKDCKIQSIEIASGFAVNINDLPKSIEKAKQNKLSVMVEIGYKNKELDDKLTVKKRLQHIKTAISAGADYIILEAREIGEGYSVFKKNESRNDQLIDGIFKILPLEKVIFEAPTRDSQIKLVNKIGPDLNIRNIPFDEIPRVETIRRRLHADTFIKK